MWTDDTKIVLRSGRVKLWRHIWVVEAKNFNYSHYSTDPDDRHEGGFGPWAPTAFYSRKSTAEKLAAQMRRIGPKDIVWQVVKYVRDAAP